MTERIMWLIMLDHMTGDLFSKFNLKKKHLFAIYQCDGLILEI